MKIKLILITLLSLSTAVLAQTNPVATTGPVNSITEDADAKYTAVIEKRTDAILKNLALDDQAKAAKVHDIIIAQYRTLNTWHNDNDAKLKAAKGDTNAVAQIRASLKTIHDQYLANLAANLTPEQVEKVKDLMTYGKVEFTYKGYIVQYPELTDANKAKILEYLKQAREEAMDGGSAQEKTAVFTKCKGKINNYLSKQGLHPAKSKPANDAGDAAK